MRLTPKELGSVEVVLENFNKHDLPRLLNLKKYVDVGGTLDEFQLSFLEQAMKKSRGSIEF